MFWSLRQELNSTVNFLELCLVFSFQFLRILKSMYKNLFLFFLFFDFLPCCTLSFPLCDFVLYTTDWIFYYFFVLCFVFLQLLQFMKFRYTFQLSAKQQLLINNMLLQQLLEHRTWCFLLFPCNDILKQLCLRLFLLIYFLFPLINETLHNNLIHAKIVILYSKAECFVSISSETRV